MNLFKLLTKKKTPENSSGGKIEDVRKTKHDAGEVILNLWYITDSIFISSLRSRAYVASGNDEEKIDFLKKRSKTDFHKAQTHIVPESLKAEINLYDDTGEVRVLRECTHQSLEFMGGYGVLFSDIIRVTPNHGFPFDPSNALICITALLKSPDGTLTPQTDN